MTLSSIYVINEERHIKSSKNIPNYSRTVVCCIKIKIAIHNFCIMIFVPIVYLNINAIVKSLTFDSMQDNIYIIQNELVHFKSNHVAVDLLF